MDMDFNGLYERKNMLYKIRVIRYIVKMEIKSSYNCKLDKR